MPRTPVILTTEQQELIGIVRAAHDNVILARQTRSAEIKRRVDAEKLRVKQHLERYEERVRNDLDHELTQHMAAQDEALIAAYNAGIPIRQISLNGFGNQHDAAVHQFLSDLREDGRIGVRTDYQSPDPDKGAVIGFPQPVDVDSLLTETMAIQPPRFTLNEQPLGQPGAEDAPAVTLTMDERDPYFARIAKNMRPGTKNATARTATLYLHPATGNLMVLESREPGDVLWDHPVARWVKDHDDLALVGYQAALLAAPFA